MGAAEQLEFPGGEYREPKRLTRCDELEAEAVEYLEQNPAFWREFCRRAFELMRHGRRNYSAKAIVEVIRWHSDVGRGEPWKVNNSYVRVFGDVFTRTYPEHAGFFRTRVRLSERRGARG